MRPCDEISHGTIENDIDQVESQDYIMPEEPFALPPRISRLRSLITTERDRTIAYCIVASLLLHLAAFAALPRIGRLQNPHSFLKPGEKVTPVRLVEFPSPASKPEPPPEKPAAISDRNHTAEKQRIPRSLPTPRAPMGSVQPPQKRIASLMPPPAPEDFVKPKEDKQRKLEKPDPAPTVEKNSKRAKTRPERERIRPLAKRHDLKNLDVDLRPTPQDIAKGFSRPSGSSAFHPDGDPDEAVVDINSREDKFFSYLLHLKQKIEAVWVYPSAAARAGIGGGLTIEFIIAKGGELMEARVLDPSGYPVLDESAIRAVKTAAPYNPLPERLQTKRLRVRANFMYITNNYFRRIL